MATAFLDTLKNKLLTAKEFKLVYDYFMDNINDEFMAKGSGIRHGIIEAVILQTARQVYKDAKFTIRPNELRLTRIAEDKFVHGGMFTSSGRMINVFYFEDIDTGLLVACEIGNITTCVARFSARPPGSVNQPATAKPSRN